MSLTVKYHQVVLSAAMQIIGWRHRVFRVLAILFFVTTTAVAQNATPIIVTDEDAKPVIGATISWQTRAADQSAAQPAYAVTDVNGRAALQLASRSQIVITAVGFESRFLSLEPGEIMNVTMQRIVTSLDNVVVTGQMDATRPQQSAENIRIIDKETINRLKANNARDLLQQQPNFRISEDNMLGSNLTLNGLGGNNVKVLVDGIPVIGRENGNIDLGQLPLTNVERVEVVEGPMSVLYSTDATAGVVNLVTRRNSNGKHLFNASLTAESPRSLYADASAWIQMRQSHFSISGGRHYFDGYPRFDTTRVQQWKPSLKYFGAAGFGWKSRRSTLELKADYFLQNTLDRGAPVRTPYEAYAFDNHYYTERINGNVTFNHAFGALHLDQTAAYSVYTRRHQKYYKDLTTLQSNEITAEDSNDGTEIHHLFYRALLQRPAFSKNIRFQAGVELNRETGSGYKIPAGTAPIVECAALGQMEWKPVQSLLLKPGLRVNYNSAYAAPLVPSLNLRWDVNQRVQWRVAVARGYRAPSMKELHLSFVDMNHDIHGNPDLLAETSWNGNAALLLQRDVYHTHVSFQTSVYCHSIANQIVLAKTDSVGLVYRYGNLDETLATGGSFDANFRARNLSFGIGMSLNGIENKSLGARMTWSPSMSSLLQWDIPKPGLSLTLAYKNIGIAPAYAYDENGLVERYLTDGYALFDALVSKKFFKNTVIISGGVKNVFDVTNVQSSLPGGVHSGGADIPVARGRFYTAGIALNLSRDAKLHSTPSTESQ